LIAVDRSAAASVPTCYLNSSDQPEVNVGADFGYTDAAIRAAIDTAKAHDCVVYFQPGTYVYNSPLINDGLTFVGQCTGGVAGTSTLSATDPDGSAIFLRGDGPRIVCLKITSPSASTRSGSNNANGITIDFATNFLVDHVVIEKTAAAGIFNKGGSDGRITSNRVSNTLGDGIHNTRSAHHTTIAFNSVMNSGDDFIAVVSYVWQGSSSHDIDIVGNSVQMQPHGRGIVVSGGYNVRIMRNNIQRCSASCIHIASEPEASWNTFEVDNVEISNNFVRLPDVNSIHNANLLIWCGNTNGHIRNIYGLNNNFDSSREMVRAVADVGCSMSGVTVSGFYG
jgi:Pectate lyase superfamily protein